MDQPQHGILNLNANGSFNYTPEPDYFGPDGFTYRAFDGVSHSAVTGVGITVDPVQDPGKLAFSADEFFANENSATGIVTVVRTGGSEGTISVDYSTSPLTATEFADYSPASGTLTFNPGEVSKDIFVGLNTDAEAELSETLSVHLNNPTGAATFAGGMPPNATLTIVNSDPPPSIYFNDPVPVAEGNAGATNVIPFVLTLSEPSTDPVEVNYNFGFGSATGGEDFDDTITSSTITFAPGETSKTINVPIVGDSTNEFDENVSINLFGATNALVRRLDRVRHDHQRRQSPSRRNRSNDPAPAPAAPASSIPVGTYVSSPDGDDLDITIETQPLHGTVQIDNNGTPDDASDDVITYIPEGNGFADDSFAYKVTDPYGGSASGTIAIESRGIASAPQPNRAGIA